MKNLITGLHHVAFKCNGLEEFEKTNEFYGKVLGLEELRHWGEGKEAAVMYRAGNGAIEIFANGEDTLSEGAIRHFSFATKDVEGCVAAVREAGYSITVEPKDIELATTPVTTARIAFCIGPVGEEIEFFQEN